MLKLLKKKIFLKLSQLTGVIGWLVVKASWSPCVLVKRSEAGAEAADAAAPLIETTMSVVVSPTSGDEADEVGLGPPPQPWTARRWAVMLSLRLNFFWQTVQG